MRSSSSLGSRWVRRFPPFDTPWDQLSGQQLRRSCRRQRHGYRCEPVHLHRSVRQRRVGHLVGLRIRPLTTQGNLINAQCRPCRYSVDASPVAATARTLSAARGLPTSSVGSRSTRLGVCSRCRLRAHQQPRCLLRLGCHSTNSTGHPDDKWGWAVQGALQIKNIPTGAGDTLNIQAVYTDGATRYNFQSLGSAELRDVRRHRHRRAPTRARLRCRG